MPFLKNDNLGLKLKILKFHGIQPMAYSYKHIEIYSEMGTKMSWN